MEYDYDDAKVEFIKGMERIIAKHCSSDNYKFGNYRYPVHYRKNGQGWKATGTANVSLKDVPTMYYKFGTHKMEIGKALLEILDFIEERSDYAFSFDFFNDGKEDD